MLYVGSSGGQHGETQVSRCRDVLFHSIPHAQHMPFVCMLGTGCVSQPPQMCQCVSIGHEPGSSILATALPTLSLLPLHLPAPAQAYTARWSRWTIAITFRPTRSRGMPYWPVADSLTKSQQRARSSSIALNELVDLRTQIRIRFLLPVCLP